MPFCPKDPIMLYIWIQILNSSIHYIPGWREYMPWHIRPVSVGVSSTQLPRLESKELCKCSVMVMTLLSHFMTLFSPLSPHTIGIC